MHPLALCFRTGLYEQFNGAGIVANLDAIFPQEGFGIRLKDRKRLSLSTL